LRSIIAALVVIVRPRFSMSGSKAERIRKAVSNRIRDSIERIEKENPALGEHLAEAVRMGMFCSYSPKGSSRRS